MKPLRTLSLLLLAGWFGSTPASAQGPTPGSCQLGTANNTLDVNNVAATVYNTGSLFFGGSGQALYFVPQAAELSPIFAAGIWIGGRVGTDTRFAGSRYDGFQYWPGPLNPNGSLPNPADCSPYDRIWSVSRQQILDYEGGATPATDLVEWPAELGAPVLDGDGNPDNYNLAGGDRPDIVGDQALWWVMNDVGGTKTAPGPTSDPIGMEVQVLAFAFDRNNALGNTTFYRYTLIYKGTAPLTDTYVSVFSDPDLGNASDDYVHADTALSMGVVYNADENDEGATGYGTPPPAIGFDFFQGPIVDGDTLGLSSASYFINGGPAGTEDPGDLSEYYNYQQGLWGDGLPVREGGDGRSNPSGAITRFAFPGDPVTGQFWTEENTGAGPNTPSDRRLVVTTGPFTMNPGDRQDIVFGIVYAQGINRLSSISALRAGDLLAQAAYDLDFNLPIPPPAPPLCVAGSGTREPGSGNCLEAVETNGVAAITWGYPPPSASTTYITEYENSGYSFEGFNIYRYPTSAFSANDRELVATYDLVNGITTVNNLVFDPEIGQLIPVVAVRGTDSGVRFSFTVENATNYQDYFFGVSAYAVDEDAALERVIESSPTPITVRPSSAVAGSGGTIVNGEVGDVIMGDSVTVAGGGTVSARIVNPNAVTGATYRVEFFETIVDNTDPDHPIVETNYRIVNTTTGRVILDGEDYFNRTGEVAPQQEEVIVAEGLAFTVTGPPPAVLDVQEWNADGPIGTAPTLLASLNDASTRPPGYLVGAAGAAANDPAAVITAMDWNSFLTANIPSDYEIRWVAPEEGHAVFHRAAGTFLDCYETGTLTETGGAVTDVVEVDAPVVGGLPRMPFQLWKIEPDGTEQPVIAVVLQDGAADNCYSFTTAATGGDPFSETQYERIYGTNVPYDEAALIADRPGVFAQTQILDGEHQNFGRFQVVPYVAGPATPPQPGTAIRIITANPNLPGDVYAIDTAPYAATRGDAATAEEALDLIGVVPNPYLGRSEYESGNEERIVRFTNLPDVATIRIYTVAGTLVKTLFGGGRRSVDWNLETENNLPVASGMYLIHVEVPGVGERVLKLGVVNRRTQVDIF